MTPTPTFKTQEIHVRDGLVVEAITDPNSKRNRHWLTLRGPIHGGIYDGMRLGQVSRLPTGEWHIEDDFDGDAFELHVTMENAARVYAAWYVDQNERGRAELLNPDPNDPGDNPHPIGVPRPLPIRR